MAAVLGPYALAPAGSTGNNTHAAVQANQGARSVAIEFIIESVGATPTITYKLQGTFDGVNWFDLITVPANSDTAAVSPTQTAVGDYVGYVDLVGGRFASQWRLVTSANTNVTYHANLYTEVGV